MRSPIEVSVIVATRDRAATLNECLETLASQESEASHEIVVVDNASTDDTAATIRLWCERDDRFTAAFEGRVGLSLAKNAGVRAAAGRLLLFTDDDVLVEPGWIEAYRRFFAARPEELLVAGGAVRVVPHDLGAWPQWLGDGTAELPALDHGEGRRLEPYEYVWGANLAVPATVFERLGAWDESLGRRGLERGTYEDTELEDRVRSAGGAVWFCPEAAVRHRVARAWVTPQRVVARAFNRGTNDHWRSARKGAPNEALRSPAPCRARAGAVLLARLLSWLQWTLLFRLRRDPAVLERARRSAWAAGWTMQALLSIESARGNGIVRRLTLFVRARALQLTPADPDA